MNSIFENNNAYPLTGPCLLHRDYHVLRVECTHYAIEWLRDNRPSFSEWFKPFAYVTEWEARLLKDVWGIRRAAS
jgi:hypothetical protein